MKTMGVKFHSGDRKERLLDLLAKAKLEAKAKERNFLRGELKAMGVKYCTTDTRNRLQDLIAKAKAKAEEDEYDDEEEQNFEERGESFGERSDGFEEEGDDFQDGDDDFEDDEEEKEENNGEREEEGECGEKFFETLKSARELFIYMRSAQNFEETNARLTNVGEWFADR